MRIGPAFLQTFASQVVQSVASIATGILIARGLGPAGQGQYAVLLAAVGLFSTIAAAGQFEGHVLDSAGQLSRGRILLVRSLVQALAAALVLAITRPLWMDSYALQGGTVLATLLSAVLLFEVLALLFRGINLGQHNIAAYNLVTLAQRVTYLVLVAALALGHRFSVAAVLAAWLVAVGVNVAISGSWIWRRSERTLMSRDAVVRGWSASLARGIRALLTISVTLLLVRADVYMLGPMLGTPAVGQISVASTAAEYLWYVPSILASVLFAAVAASRGPESVERICRSTRTTVAVLAPVVLVLAIVGRQLVPWVYGARYAEAGVLFLLLLPGMTAISVHLVLDAYFAGLGFPPISYGSAASALVLKVVLNLVAVPTYGVQGAAVVTSMVFILLLSVKIVGFRHATGTALARLLVPTWADVAHGSAVARAWIAKLTGARA